MSAASAMVSRAIDWQAELPDDKQIHMLLALPEPTWFIVSNIEQVDDVLQLKARSSSMFGLLSEDADLLCPLEVVRAVKLEHIFDPLVCREDSVSA